MENTQKRVKAVQASFVALLNPSRTRGSLIFEARAGVGIKIQRNYDDLNFSLSHHFTPLPVLALVLHHSALNLAEA